MLRILISILMFVFLLLFVTSPFAALAGVMLILFIAGAIFLLGNIFQTLLGSDGNS
ncbi:hypothetical protein FDUTEX481_03121 [Tolypothrix sp. PCC 7601]|nr:hypothetical protein FDUTEX481_03121 [Tolypothrix sp. PCC 7601]